MNRWQHWILFLALLGAAESFLGFMVSEKPVPFLGIVRRQFESWGSWAAVSVGILAYTRWLRRMLRRPGEPSGRLPSGWRRGLWVGAHFLGAAVACTLYAMAYAALVNGQSSIMEPKQLEFRKVFTVSLVHSAVFGLMIYWAVVGIEHGLALYQRLRERERQAIDLARELAQARLEALRTQLHPHFLFNTLHTVSSLIHSRPATADRVVVRLSELLRASLDQSSSHVVPLREELQMLDRYLEIEQARFGDRLTVERELAPGVENLLVPALILQPLVENAVRHGIEPRESAGRIRIRACRSGDQLELVVSDNGPGLPGEPESRGRQGIGLSNTRSRLQQLYGESQTCELNTPPGGGLEVRLRLPCEECHAEPLPHPR